MKTAALRAAARRRRGGRSLHPSNPLFEVIAGRAGGTPVPVRLEDGRLDPDGCWPPIGPRTRLLMLCNPNDPDRRLHRRRRTSASCSRGCPGTSTCCWTRATSSSRTSRTQDAALKLTEAFPNLLVFRTFSRAYGLSGLRAGYVVGSPGRGRHCWRRWRRCWASTRSRRRRCCRLSRPATATSSGGATTVIEQRRPADRTRCAASACDVSRLAGELRLVPRTRTDRRRAGRAASSSHA